MRRAVVISVTGLVVVVGLMGGAWWWVNGRADNVSVDSPGGSISLGTDTTQSPAGNGSRQQTDVKGATNMAQNEDFAQYDKYKTSQTALFAELKPGDGAVASAGKVLTVNYRGWLTDGRVFDESYERGKPFSFTLGEHRVIAGWEQGLDGMKVGGKRRLIVPPAAGYGAQATGPIPANSVLVFDVELLEVR